MAKLEEFLQQISKIVVEEKTQQEERRKRGENFNIFKVLGLSYYEVRLHSPFLAELLKPEGDHGLGDKFLKAFLDDVIWRMSGLNDIKFDTAKAEVVTELYIGPISSDGTRGGIIDLLIQDDRRNAIIIENKIGAKDQSTQLLRYNNYAKYKKYSKYILLYLTLDGHQPSEISTGKNPDFTYFCISYSKDIMDWLNTCHRIATSHPIIRETIVQYIINLKQILNIMSDENQQKTLNCLMKNTEATLQILALQQEIGIKIRKKFIEERLKALAEEHGMDFEFDEKFLSLENDNEQLKFKLKEYPKEYPKVYFAIQKYQKKGIYYSIYNDSGKRVDIEPFKGWEYDKEHNKGGKWPYGWKYFDDPLKDWDNPNTLLDMHKGNKIYDEIDNALTDIIDNDLIGKLSALIEKEGK